MYKNPLNFPKEDQPSQILAVEQQHQPTIEVEETKAPLLECETAIINVNLSLLRKLLIEEVEDTSELFVPKTTTFSKKSVVNQTSPSSSSPSSSLFFHECSPSRKQQENIDNNDNSNDNDRVSARRNRGSLRSYTPVAAQNNNNNNNNSSNTSDEITRQTLLHIAILNYVSSSDSASASYSSSFSEINASENESKRIIELLIVLGASVWQRNSDGLSSLQLCMKCCPEFVSTLLLTHGIDRADATTSNARSFFQDVIAFSPTTASTSSSSSSFPQRIGILAKILQLYHNEELLQADGTGTNAMSILNDNFSSIEPHDAILCYKMLSDAVEGRKFSENKIDDGVANSSSFFSSSPLRSSSCNYLIIFLLFAIHLLLFFGDVHTRGFIMNDNSNNNTTNSSSSSSNKNSSNDIWSIKNDHVNTSPFLFRVVSIVGSDWPSATNENDSSEKSILITRALCVSLSIFVGAIIFAFPIHIFLRDCLKFRLFGYDDVLTAEEETRLERQQEIFGLSSSLPFKKRQQKEEKKEKDDDDNNGDNEDDDDQSTKVSAFSSSGAASHSTLALHYKNSNNFYHEQHPHHQQHVPFQSEFDIQLQHHQQQNIIFSKTRRSVEAVMIQNYFSVNNNNNNNNNQSTILREANKIEQELQSDFISCRNRWLLAILGSYITLFCATYIYEAVADSSTTKSKYHPLSLDSTQISNETAHLHLFFVSLYIFVMLFLTTIDIHLSKLNLLPTTSTTTFSTSSYFMLRFASSKWKGNTRFVISFLLHFFVLGCLGVWHFFSSFSTSSTVRDISTNSLQVYPEVLFEFPHIFVPLFLSCTSVFLIVLGIISTASYFSSFVNNNNGNGNNNSSVLLADAIEVLFHPHHHSSSSSSSITTKSSNKEQDSSSSSTRNENENDNNNNLYFTVRSMFCLPAVPFRGNVSSWILFLFIILLIVDTSFFVTIYLKSSIDHLYNSSSTREKWYMIIAFVGSIFPLIITIIILFYELISNMLICSCNNNNNLPGDGQQLIESGILFSVERKHSHHHQTFHKQQQQQQQQALLNFASSSSSSRKQRQFSSSASSSPAAQADSILPVQHYHHHQQQQQSSSISASSEKRGEDEIQAKSQQVEEPSPYQTTSCEQQEQEQEQEEKEEEARISKQLVFQSAAKQQTTITEQQQQQQIQEETEEEMHPKPKASVVVMQEQENQADEDETEERRKQRIRNELLQLQLEQDRQLEELRNDRDRDENQQEEILKETEISTTREDEEEEPKRQKQVMFVDEQQQKQQQQAEEVEEKQIPTITRQQLLQQRAQQRQEQDELDERRKQLLHKYPNYSSVWQMALENNYLGLEEALNLDAELVSYCGGGGLAVYLDRTSETTTYSPQWRYAHHAAASDGISPALSLLPNQQIYRVRLLYDDPKEYEQLLRSGGILPFSDDATYNPTVKQQLIRHGDEYGAYLLHYSIFGNSIGCMRLLLQRGADPLARTRSGSVTCIELAKIMGREIMVELLESFAFSSETPINKGIF